MTLATRLHINLSSSSVLHAGVGSLTSQIDWCDLDYSEYIHFIFTGQFILRLTLDLRSLCLRRCTSNRKPPLERHLQQKRSKTSFLRLKISFFRVRHFIEFQYLGMNAPRGWAVITRTSLASESIRAERPLDEPISVIKRIQSRILYVPSYSLQQIFLWNVAFIDICIFRGSNVWVKLGTPFHVASFYYRSQSCSSSINTLLWFVAFQWNLSKPILDFIRSKFGVDGSIVSSSISLQTGASSTRTRAHSM